MVETAEQIYYGALRMISAENDQLAVDQLVRTGSYSAFDEPCSVKIARDAILRGAAAPRPTSDLVGALEEIKRLAASAPAKSADMTLGDVYGIALHALSAHKGAAQ